MNRVKFDKLNIEGVCVALLTSGNNFGLFSICEVSGEHNCFHINLAEAFFLKFMIVPFYQIVLHLLKKAIFSKVLLHIFLKYYSEIYSVTWI